MRATLLFMPAWNPWIRTVLTQFDHETHPRPRPLRCCAPSIRRGDPARVRVGNIEVDAIIVGIECSVVLLERAPVVSADVDASAHACGIRPARD